MERDRSRAYSLPAALALFLFFFSCSAFAESVASMPAQPFGYVTDNANVLSPEERTKLEQYCAQVEQLTHAQVFAAVIKTVDNEEPISQFANELFAKWKPGQKGKDNGALLVLAVQDRHYFIEVGYGLEGFLNDARVGDIGRTMVPYLKQSNYDAAVESGITGLGQAIANDAKVSLTPPALPVPRQGEYRPQQAPGVARFLPLLIFIIMLVLISRRGGGGGGPGGFLMGMLLGNMMNCPRYRGDDDSWGGGGFGGGSSGGGFGGGGGGDSGGGGAGGSW